MKWIPLALLLLAPGMAAAQMQSGPSAPATGAQLPPRGPADAPQPGQASPGQGAPGTGSDDTVPPRTAPPADHRVLGGPPVPGAQPRQDSGGFAPQGGHVPERPGNRPDASTTGR